MKNFGLIVGMCFLAFSTIAATPSVLDEAAMLGTMAGLAETCGENNKKLADFELISARLIANKSVSDQEEIRGYRRYAEEKATAIRKQKDNPQMSCDEILHRFENMPIFKSVVYSDGSLKLADGTFLKAKRPPAKLNKKNK